MLGTHCSQYIANNILYTNPKHRPQYEKHKPILIPKKYDNADKCSESSDIPDFPSGTSPPDHNIKDIYLHLLAKSTLQSSE